MSEFKCEVVRIDNVENHPNADRLSLVTIRGYKCISAKLEDGSPRYNAGDLVVYIPEAAILPDWIMKKMGFWDNVNGCGALSGGRKNRVKAIKLRGEFSQGILYPVQSDKVTYDLPIHYVEKEFQDFVKVEEGQDVSEILGITKYEPEVPTQMRGVVGALFGITKKFDIESIQNNPNVFTEDDDVVITEKLHGTLFQTGIVHGSKLTDAQKEICYRVNDDWYAFVTSKGLGAKGMVQKITEDNLENIYVKTMHKYFVDSGVFAQVSDLFGELNKLGETNENYRDMTQVTYFGEIYGAGVQDLSYGKSVPELRLFGVMVDDRFLNFEGFRHHSKAINIDTVPVLYEGKFSMGEVLKHRDGKTTLGGSHIREGVVILSKEEVGYHKLPGFRKQLKAVSPAYLLREGGTEFN